MVGFARVGNADNGFHILQIVRCSLSALVVANVGRREFVVGNQCHIEELLLERNPARRCGQFLLVIPRAFQVLHLVGGGFVVDGRIHSFHVSVRGLFQTFQAGVPHHIYKGSVGCNQVFGIDKVDIEAHHVLVAADRIDELDVAALVEKRPGRGVDAGAVGVEAHPDFHAVVALHFGGLGHQAFKIIAVGADIAVLGKELEVEIGTVLVEKN